MSIRAKRKPRPTKPGGQTKPDIEAMIRVDHAGEYGALRIYQGQLAVLGRDKNAEEDVRAIRHMAAQEQAHFDAFDKLLLERRVRPTALQPIWQVAGYALGAATALIGPKAAMACTAAVEEAIDEHYGAQAETLGQDEAALKDLIETSRADELAHREEALAHGAEQAPAYRLLSAAIKFGCQVAIKLSERV